MHNIADCVAFEMRVKRKCAQEIQLDVHLRATLWFQIEKTLETTRASNNGNNLLDGHKNVFSTFNTDLLLDFAAIF